VGFTPVASPIMMTIQKICTGGTFVALASLLAVLFWSPQSAYSANVELSYTIVSAVTGSTTIAIDMSPVLEQADNDAIAHKTATKYPGYDDYTGTANKCYPGGGGTQGYPATTYWNINASHQTSNTTGGYADCSQSGFYYINFATYKPNNAYNCATPKDCFYVKYYWDADTQQITPVSADYIPGFNSVSLTRFTDIDITGTSTVNISADYFLEQSEIDTTISATNPTAVNFRYSLRPSTTSNAFAETIDNTVQGTSTVDIDIAGFVDGTYDLLVSFTNGGCSLGLSACPFPKSYVYSSFTISGGVLSTVGDNEYYDGTTPPPTTSYQECSITQIGNCISNAFVYLFFPSQTALNSFTILGDQLDIRFPFAYVFDTLDVFQILFETAQTESLDLTLPFATYGDITLISEEMLSEIPMSDTIKTLLTYILWIMFMLQMYNRTRNIFNSQTV